MRNRELPKTEDWKSGAKNGLFYEKKTDYSGLLHCFYPPKRYPSSDRGRASRARSIASGMTFCLFWLTKLPICLLPPDYQ